jgi:predicted ABC-type exoprotein transport system permease subunit
MENSNKNKVSKSISPDTVEDSVEKNKKEDAEAFIIPEEILENIPVEERGKIVSIMKQSMFSSITKRSNPIAEKITSEHITQLISKSDEQDKRDRTERKSLRNHNLIILLIGLVFIGFLIVFLQKDKELLVKIILAIISFLGGFGLGKSVTKKEE